jgi:hypothetical protein
MIGVRSCTAMEIGFALNAKEIDYLRKQKNVRFSFLSPSYQYTH